MDRNIVISTIMDRDATAEFRGALASRIARHIGSAENQTTAIPRITLHQRTAPTGPCHLIYEPSIVVVAQGRKEVQIGSETVSYDSSRYLLTSVDLPTITRVADATASKPCLAVTLKLDISVVKEFLSREEFHAAHLPAEGRGMSTAPNTGEFLSAWCRMLDLLSSPVDIPFLAGLIEREIVYRVLRGPKGAGLRAVATQGDQRHYIAKAIAWVRMNYMKPLRMDELADMAGMAVSTLHHRFRSLTGMSPLQYQKQIRLQAARARMLADEVDAATVAFEVGYESASQFNREYSRLFGRPPVQDVRNLRSPGDHAFEPVATIESGA